MLKKYAEWHRKKYNQTQKFLFDITALPLFFFIIIPSVAFWFMGSIDRQFALPKILMQPFNIYLGVLLFVGGLILSLWTVLLFYRIGRGTPSPFMPTQKLVATGPFAYSRNPMVLGVMAWISGLGGILNSFSFLIGGLIIPLAYLVYIKLLEERELEMRFGREYLKYKKRVPFLIPNFKM